MKYIVKENEPDEFTRWKAKKNDNWEPTYSNLGGDTKKAVKKALMTEQGYLCCYCERRLTDGDSHIEHLQPQSTTGSDSVDYGNLLCSCMNQLRKGEPRHCGHKRGNWFDTALLVSPLNRDCETRFAYSWNGSIRPASPGDQGAVETIERLGLGIAKLNRMREKALEPFIEEGLTEEEVSKLVTDHLVRNPQTGYFGEFWTMISWLFLETNS